MVAASEIASPASGGWRKLAALVLALAAVGLPVNTLVSYVALLIAAVVIFSGEVSARGRAWAAALAVVAAVIAAQVLLAPPRIEEGHNVFLPDAKVLQQGLPADVYRQMTQEFDALYPPAVRCKPGTPGCWQDQGRPGRLYAFSADGIWRKSAASRDVTSLDFSDPVWLRLGFINELKYNWTSAAPDVHRNDRDRRFWMGLKRWHLAMPWFEMVRLPAAYVGGQLCWHGEIMWEGAGGHFVRLPDGGCRAIAAADAGRHVFGLAIAPDTLAMQLKAPWPVRIEALASAVVTIVAVIALVALLVRVRPRRLAFPLILIALAVIVIAVDDASFLGGVRPYDGGDDGLYYESAARGVLQNLLAGNFYEVLRGYESVYWYAPGLRYFLALQHIVFGETYLGYLSLILLLPFLVYKLFLRFFPRDWALALIFLFVAVPVGVLFGTSFLQYPNWAARGFADPAAYIFFLAGIIPVIGATATGASSRVKSALFGALLLALAVIVRPVVAPAAAVLLSGAALAALYNREWLRLAALCIGFLPVLLMPLHNWYFGHVFLMFSSNIDEKGVLVMPPSAYVAALHELITFNFVGGNCLRALAQIVNWLRGPAESYATIPFNAAGVALLGYVVLRGRRFDPWLRLIGAAALTQHLVAFFYRGDVARYHLLTWFLTMIVVIAFVHEVGIGWLQRRYPKLSERFANHPLSVWLSSGLTRLQKVTE